MINVVPPAPYLGLMTTNPSQECKDSWFDELYAELHRRARFHMSRQPAGHSLQPTALVNEVFVKMTQGGLVDAGSREEFLLVASTAMRHVLVDHARRKQALKRDAGKRAETPLDRIAIECEDHAIDLEALDLALTNLASIDEPMTRAVELRFFAGLSVPETAAILGIPQRTLERKWLTTRAWLYRQINESE